MTVLSYDLGAEPKLRTFGPSDWSRTSGLLNPIQARYQTAPHPVVFQLRYYIILF